jgi:site-specific DNA-methyltransferase (adenine-specific)
MIRLFNEAAEDFLKRDLGSYDTIFMDPPDNSGLEYDGYKDLRDDYYPWLEGLILESMKRCKVLWISYYWKHDITLKFLVHRILRDYHPSWLAKTFIWQFNFGQNMVTDCGSGYRPILRLARYDKAWSTESIRVESERQRLNDSRACETGCVPLDVWEFPRICGNFPERRKWHPTQHPEALMERIYKMSGTRKALDLFAGSGTSIRVAKRLGFDLDTVEISGQYCEKLRSEHGSVLTEE